MPREEASRDNMMAVHSGTHQKVLTAKAISMATQFNASPPKSRHNATTAMSMMKRINMILHCYRLTFVLKGKLLIKLRDRDIWLQEGEFVIIPKGIDHLPIADEEAHVILLEPKTTLNTGNTQNERTVTNLEQI